MKRMNRTGAKKWSVLVLCAVLLSGCGRDATQKCVYRDENIEFSVVAPESWSYAIHKQAKDAEGQKKYDYVDMILYPEREEENRICILHKENGELFAIEETGTDIILNTKLKGVQTEDISEAGITRYIVLDGGEYSIIVLCQPDFYEKNEETINTVLAGLKIKQ